MPSFWTAFEKQPNGGYRRSATIFKFGGPYALGEGGAARPGRPGKEGAEIEL